MTTQHIGIMSSWEHESYLRSGIPLFRLFQLAPINLGQSVHFSCSSSSSILAIPRPTYWSGKRNPTKNEKFFLLLTGTFFALSLVPIYILQQNEINGNLGILKTFLKILVQNYKFFCLHCL